MEIPETSQIPISVVIAKFNVDALEILILDRVYSNWRLRYSLSFPNRNRITALDKGNWELGIILCRILLSQ